MQPLLQLSLRQLAGRWRLLLILILAALPVAIAVTMARVADADTGGPGGMLDGMVVAAILPIVTMTLATAAFGNELDDRTLSYLVLKPVARWRIVVPKLLAVIAIAAPLLVASGVLTAFLGPEGTARGAAAVGVALLLGVLAYSSIFTWLGLITSRGLAFALIYVFLWEGLLTTFLPGIRYLSVCGYTLALIHGIDDRVLGESGAAVIEFPAAIAGTAAVTVVFVWLAVRRLRRMDVP